MKRWIAILFAASLGVGLLWSQESAPQILFIGENQAGKVWANTSLTRERTDQPYLPMVVAVQNMSQSPITLDRSSFSLVDLDGLVYSMPTVQQFRQYYDKALIDERMVSYGGIPWEGWRWNRRLERANFFPSMQARRGNTTVDKVSLRQRHAMVDLLYFERPRNVSLDRPLLLEIRPTKGWEEPIRLRIVLF
jgi:hypothetical protein